MELQDSLIRFSKFLQENDSKRVRALKKAADEHKIRLEKETELDQLGVTVESLKDEKDSILGILEKNLKWVPQPLQGTCQQDLLLALLGKPMFVARRGLAQYSLSVVWREWESKRRHVT